MNLLGYLRLRVKLTIAVGLSVLAMAEAGSAVGKFLTAAADLSDDSADLAGEARSLLARIRAG